MPVVKKRNQQTESRLLLESDDPVELPPAEVAESAVVLQFETFRPHVPELLDALREGTWAEPVPVMMDGATFVVHGATRSFWVKLWHSSEERTSIDRLQIISCLPSTRGFQVIVEDPEARFEEGEEDEEDSADELPGDDLDEDGDLGDDNWDSDDDDDDASEKESWSDSG